jgi:hypothetical protein
VTNDEKGPVDPADEQLMDQLKGLLDRTAPIPAWLVEAGKASYGLRSVDAELAELTRDSMVDEPALAVRGAGEPRTLTFDAPGLTVEFEVTGSGRERRLLGQLVPPQAARVQVDSRPPDGQDVTGQSVEADARGRFALGGIGAGPLRLTCHREGQPAVATDWVLVG